MLMMSDVNSTTSLHHTPPFLRPSSSLLNPPPHSSSSLLLLTPPPHSSSSLLLLTPAPPPHSSSSLLLLTPPPHSSSLLLTPSLHSSLLLLKNPARTSPILLLMYAKIRTAEISCVHLRYFVFHDLWKVEAPDFRSLIDYVKLVQPFHHHRHHFVNIFKFNLFTAFILFHPI